MLLSGKQLRACATQRTGEAGEMFAPGNERIGKAIRNSEAAAGVGNVIGNFVEVRLRGVGEDE